MACRTYSLNRNYIINGLGGTISGIDFFFSYYDMVYDYIFYTCLSTESDMIISLYNIIS